MMDINIENMQKEYRLKKDYIKGARMQWQMSAIHTQV